MIFRVVLAREAEKNLDRLDRTTEQRIRARIQQLSDNPFQLSDNPFDLRLSAPLTERAGVRKSRVGGWRILFTVNTDEQVVGVLAVDTRGQVYRH